MKVCFELKGRDLVRKSDAGSVSRSRNISVSFMKMGESKAYFNVRSQSFSSRSYVVTIFNPSITLDTSLDELKKIVRDSDIQVGCTCDAFLYRGFKYITYKNKAGIEPEGRPPYRTNPRQEGMLCKHLIAVLKYLGVS